MTTIIETKKTQCLAVFTVDGADQILKDGYSQSWRLSTQNAAKVDYLVCVQNREENWGNPKAPHGTAFLVGKICGVASSKDQGRKLINISHYATINVPGAWDGNRNPIAYMTLEDFGLKLEDLEFHPVPTASELMAVDGKANSVEIAPLSIEEAKRGLAAKFGLNPEQIDIIIRG